MAIIPVYHVVADYFPVGEVHAADTTNHIHAGMVVELDANGRVVVCQGASGHQPVGLAGDSNVAPLGAYDANGIPTFTNNTPFSNPLIVNSQGWTVWTQNRVSDPLHNETVASGQMTVYNSNGKFWTNLFVPAAITGQAYQPGDVLYASGTAGYLGYLTNQQDGVGAANVAVGICFAEPTDYPSGVPGTDTTDGSMSLGEFLGILLRV